MWHLWWKEKPNMMTTFKSLFESCLGNTFANLRELQRCEWSAKLRLFRSNTGIDCDLQQRITHHYLYDDHYGILPASTSSFLFWACTFRKRNEYKFATIYEFVG